MKKPANKPEDMEVITDPQVLINLATASKSVYVVSWKRRSPAAWIISMQFRMVMLWLNKGWFLKDKDNE